MRGPVVGRRGCRRTSVSRARGSALAAAECRDAARGGRGDRRRGYLGHRRRTRGVRDGGCDSALPGGGGDHERRGGQPCASGSARASSEHWPRPCSNGAGKGRSGDRRSFLRPPAGGALARRESRCRARRVVPGQRGGQCARRRADRTGVSERTHAGQLAEGGGTDSHFLRRASGRPAREPEGSLHEQVSRRAERALVPLRSRAHLRPLYALRSARDPAGCRGHRHSADSRRCAQ